MIRAEVLVGLGRLALQLRPPELSLMESRASSAAAITSTARLGLCTMLTPV